MENSPAAEPVESDGVLASDLPTVAQIARIYPDYAGGKREMSPDRGQGGQGDIQECWDWSTGFRSANGQSAAYSDAAGDSPVFTGSDGVTVSVYQFSTEANAKRAENVFTKFVRECRDRRPTNDQASEYQPVRTPRGYHGMLETEQTETLDDATQEIRKGQSRYLQIVSRKGRLLIRVFIQRDGEGRPNEAKAIELAKLSRAMAG